MEDVTYIYALTDPIVKNEFHIYIGKSDNPYVRYYQHLKNKDNTHKYKWIKSLLKNNLLPDLQILEQCNKDNWKEKEIDWIAFYKQCEYSVVNGTDGGDGNSWTGKHHSEETRNKMHHPHKTYTRRSDETQKALNELRSKTPSWTPKGSRRSEESKQRMRKPHKKMSEEGRRRLSESHKGRIPWNKGLPMAAHVRKALLESGGNTGHHHSEEAKLKMSQSHLRRNKDNANKIVTN